jgi:hypothetical protein
MYEEGLSTLDASPASPVPELIKRDLTVDA